MGIATGGGLFAAPLPGLFSERGGSVLGPPATRGTSGVADRELEVVTGIGGGGEGIGEYPRVDDKAGDCVRGYGVFPGDGNEEVPNALAVNGIGGTGGFERAAL